MKINENHCTNSRVIHENVLNKIKLFNFITWLYLCSTKYVSLFLKVGGRAKKQPNFTPHLGKILNVRDTLNSTHPIFTKKDDGMPLKHIFDKSFSISLHYRAGGEAPSIMELETGMIWFTGGSKINAGTVAGFCCTTDDTSLFYALNSYTTVF